MLAFRLFYKKVLYDSRTQLQVLSQNFNSFIKALFQETGVEIARRASIPVIRDEAGPLLLYGIALDERALPIPGEKAWKLCFFEL